MADPTPPTTLDIVCGIILITASAVEISWAMYTLNQMKKDLSFEYLKRQLYWIIGYNVVMSAKGCIWCFMKKNYTTAEPSLLVFLQFLIQAFMLLTAMSFLWSVTYLYLKTSRQLDSWA
jgi:predicted neutral ceramidase superfamily lipid hydrolase